MSYVDQKDFAPTNGIQELSLDEVDMVDGGARGDGAAIIGNLVGVP